MTTGDASFLTGASESESESELSEEESEPEEGSLVLAAFLRVSSSESEEESESESESLELSLLESLELSESELSFLATWKAGSQCVFYVKRERAWETHLLLLNLLDSLLLFDDWFIFLAVAAITAIAALVR